MIKKEGKGKNQRFFRPSFFPKTRRGSHVGVIASFTIFILFLLGLFFAIQPLLKNHKENQLLMDRLEAKLLDEISNNLTIATISTAGGVCLKLSNSGVEVSNVKAIVKDSGGNEIISGYDGSNLIIQAGSQPALWVYYAEEFDVNSGTDVSCVAPNIKSVRRTEEYFEKKIGMAIGNYEAIKTSMNLPPGNGFSYSFQYNNGTVVSAGINDTAENIYVNEIPIQYIDSDADSLSGKLIIKAW